MLFPYDQPFQRGALMLFQYTHVGESAGGTFTIKIGGFRNRQDAAFTSNLGSQGSGFLGASEYRWKATGVNWGLFFWVVVPQTSLFGTLVCRRQFTAKKLDGCPERLTMLSADFSRASLRGLPHAETSYEITSIFCVMKGVSIQPGWQVIVHHGGDLPTALVGILHLNINFVKLAQLLSDNYLVRSH